MKFKTALVSVSDKSGLVEFLSPLAKEGLKIISTGGTAKHLRQAGLEVQDVSDLTQFPEVMGGRVKTLHPNVHMALLAREGEAEDFKLLQERGLQPIDLVVVNLYPFEETLAKDSSLEEQVEQIDIGGPSMLRAAAKNYSRVTVVCDPADYSEVLANPPDLEGRKALSAKVFSLTASYDAMITEALSPQNFYEKKSFGGALVQPLRYGENPQQSASWYRLRGSRLGLHQAERLQGKELSYNNLLDLDSAFATLSEFSDPACVVVKHNSPCGLAVGKDLSKALLSAVQADPVSVFGGILALNGRVELQDAKALSGIFLECILAPSFSKEALEFFSSKKNLRLLAWPQMLEFKTTQQFRSIAGGFLVQSADQVLDWDPSWEVIGDQKPSEQIKKDLSLAWKVCAHLKSNAIAVIGSGQTLGLGMGQVNRVDAVDQALTRWKKFHPDSAASDAVLASDAFFPFPDSIERAAEAGIRWVIQPGGSVKDEEVIATARRLGVQLVLTRRRHFLH